MKNRLALLIQIAIALLFYTGVSATPLLNCHPSCPGSDTNAAKNRSTDDPYLRLNEIDRHAARDFYRKFPQVTNEKWLKTEDGFMARFTGHDMLCKVFYDSKGRFLVTARYYGEKAMPVAVKKLVQQQYPGYSIGVVTEITTGKDPCYYVHIKDRYTVKTIQVNDSRLRIMENHLNGENPRNAPELADTRPGIE